MEKEKLFGKTLSELKAITEEEKFPSFVAKQIANWLYCKDISSIDEMSNLSKNIRMSLSGKYEFGLTPYSNVQESIDGTKKYLFPTFNGKFIESVYIPENDGRATLCISSQVGCKMGCLFCMTGKQGFSGQLSTGDILNQIRSLPEKDQLSNLVFMGMGEPLDNIDALLNALEILTAPYGYAMSPKRITVSSVGIIPALRRFLDSSNCHLAISLHSPFDEERMKLMPVQKVYPIQEVIDLLNEYDFSHQRRVSFEYILFKGINDTPAHIKELCRLLNNIQCRINLIRFHTIPGTPLEGTDFHKMEIFCDRLNEKGFIATIRKSRGQDIAAACGMLSTKKLLEKKAKISLKQTDK